MNMTHYMELLATNQPWNLLIFMAIPIILVETIAITEFFTLLSRDMKGIPKRINRTASIVAGFYFLIIFLYLFFKAVIPITVAGEWRSLIDVIAVGAYLIGVVPLLAIALMDLGLIVRYQLEEVKLKTHAIFVSVFLIVAHIAMVFGMLDPTLLSPSSHLHTM